MASHNILGSCCGHSSQHEVEDRLIQREDGDLAHGGVIPKARLLSRLWGTARKAVAHAAVDESKLATSATPDISPQPSSSSSSAPPQAPVHALVETDFAALTSSRTQSSRSTTSTIDSEEGEVRTHPTIAKMFLSAWHKHTGHWIFPGDVREVTDDYELGGLIGKGQFGLVCTCTSKDRPKGPLFACKTILKENLYMQESIDTVRNEVGVLRALVGHPNIARLHGVYEDKQSVSLILDYCSGGTLFDYIGEQSDYSEHAAAKWMRSIVEVVKHCHSHHVVHRDIKLTNFLLSDDSDMPTLKAIDFGVSCFFKEGVPLTKTEGSPLYIAPEVLDESYGPECDIWSCGICLYVLLCGKPPFKGDSVLTTFKLIKEGKLDLEKPKWAKVSASAKELISQMLALNPSERPTADEILEHPWMKLSGPDVQMESIFFARMHKNSGRSKLERLANVLLGETLTKDELEGVKRVFDTLDKDRNGLVTVEELQAGLRQIGQTLDPDFVSQLMKTMDIDEDGAIDFAEFVGGTYKLDEAKREKRLSELFARLDADRDGWLSREEVEKVCLEHGVKDVPSIVRVLQKFGSSKRPEVLIDYANFMAALTGPTRPSKAGLLVL